MYFLHLIIVLVLSMGLLGLADEHWAVLVDTSRYWHNLRHLTNVLAIYKVLRDHGLTNDNIILMVSDNVVCDARNPNKGRLSLPSLSSSIGSHYDTSKNKTNVYEKDMEIDYHGTDVSMESLAHVLTDQHHSYVLKSRRLLSSHHDNVVLYITGHGGDGFLKFHDTQEITSQDIAAIIHHMAAKRRYRQMLVIVDTCQADTLFAEVTSPNVTIISSSLKGENSYAYDVDREVGMSTIDRFTLKLYDFLQKEDRNLQTTTLHTLMKFMTKQTRFLGSTVSIKSTPGATPPKQILLSDFFGRHQIQSRDGNKVFKVDTFDNSQVVSLLNADEYS